MKKCALIFILSLILFTFTSIPAHAAELAAPPLVENSDTVSPNSEETQWYFRYTEDGTLQKRLWSITYGEWLTDWIDVPAA